MFSFLIQWLCQWFFYVCIVSNYFILLMYDSAISLDVTFIYGKQFYTSLLFIVLSIHPYYWEIGS